MINYRKLHIEFDVDDYGRNSGMALIRENDDGSRHVMQSDGAWVHVPIDKTISEVCGPTIKFGHSYGFIDSVLLQQFMDALWEKGVRPKERRYENEVELLKGQMNLQNNHLQDMRKLVFEEIKEKIINKESQ